jgi:hypothetical protein
MRVEGEKDGRSSDPTEARRPYTPPRLTVYGDFRRLTMAKHGTKGDGPTSNTRV